MKSYGVTIQMNPFQQYFHMVLFVSYVVLTIESMDDIHVVTIRMKPLQRYFHMVLHALQHFSK